MAVTPVTTDPSFGISYKNTVGVEDLTVYQLLSNRDSLPIPTDEFGNNPVFTEAVVTFEIKQANTDYSDQWIITEASSTDTTITVNSVAKTVTVTAIAADVGEFTIAAVRSGYDTIYRKINVFKSKAGTDGANAPDGETIVLDGSSNLKVNKHQYYDVTGDLENSFLIGEGTLVGRTVGVTAADGNISIMPGTGSNTTFNSGIDCVSIGKSNIFGGSFGRVVTDCIAIGEGLFIYGTQTTGTNNAIVIGNEADGLGKVTANHSVNLGCDPRNSVEESVCISYPSYTSGGYNTGINNTLFVQRRVNSPNTTPVDVVLDLADADVGIGGEFLLKIELNIFGLAPLSGSSTEYFTNRDVLVINDASGIVITNNIAAEKYETGTLAPTTYVHTWSTDTLTTTITPAGTLSDLIDWFINYKIDVISV